MSILSLIAVIVVVGLVLYLVGLLPMDPKVHQLLRAVVIVLLVLWLLDAFFGLGTIGHVRVR